MHKTNTSGFHIFFRRNIYFFIFRAGNITSYFLISPTAVQLCIAHSAGTIRPDTKTCMLPAAEAGFTSDRRFCILVVSLKRSVFISPSFSHEFLFFSLFFLPTSQYHFRYGSAPPGPGAPHPRSVSRRSHAVGETTHLLHFFAYFLNIFFSPYQWKRQQREIRVAEAALALFIYFCFIETFVYQVFRVGTTRCPAFAMRQFFRAREKNCRGQSVLPQPDVHKRPGRLSMYNIHNVVLCCCIGVVKRETSVRPLERKLPQPHEFASIRVQPCRMHTASRSVTRGKVHIAYFFFSSFQFFFPSLLCPFYSCSYGFTLYAS